MATTTLATEADTPPVIEPMIMPYRLDEGAGHRAR